MEYHKRKPDKETETLRIWELDKDKNPEEFKEAQEMKDENDIKVKYKDATFTMSGFNRVVNNNNEIMFAWKVKTNEKIALIYNPSNSDLDMLKTGLKLMRFEIQDVMETLKRAYNEIPKEMKNETKDNM